MSSKFSEAIKYLFVNLTSDETRCAVHVPSVLMGPRFLCISEDNQRARGMLEMLLLTSNNMIDAGYYTDRYLTAGSSCAQIITWKCNAGFESFHNATCFELKRHDRPIIFERKLLTMILDRTLFLR